VQKCQPIPRQGVLRLGQRAPDGGGASNGLVVGSEGFDDHHAVVPDLAQGGSDRIPGNVVGPWSPPIVATGVEVDQLISDEADSRGLVLLLDIHVKGVQQRSDCRGIDCAEVVGGQDLGDTRGVPVARMLYSQLQQIEPHHLHPRRNLRDSRDRGETQTQVLTPIRYMR
jgi:hypothetical protein